MLRESLARAGAAWEGPVTLHASPVSGWRLRASLHFAHGEGGPRLGLRQEGTRRVVDVLACLQLSDAMNRAARALHGALAGRPQAARVHGLELVEAPNGEGLVATLETGLARSEAPELLPIRSAAPELTGFGVRTRTGSLEWLSGSPFVEAAALGVTLRAHAASFFQANRFLYEALARTRGGARPGRRLARRGPLRRRGALRAAARGARRAGDRRVEQSRVRLRGRALRRAARGPAAR